MKLRSSVYGWKSVWMDLADELNGTFGEDKDDFTMTLPVEPIEVHYRMHAHGKKTVAAVLFRANGNFSFAIHNKNWIEEAAKPFGLQDIVVGYGEFDREYIIQGNEERLVKSFFTDDNLREQIEGQKSVRLELRTTGSVNGISLPQGVHAIVFEDKSAINSFERLNSINELLKSVYKRLVEMTLAKADKVVQMI